MASYDERMSNGDDAGPVFDGVRVGRAATGALLQAGYRIVPDLPEDLDELLDLHGVGPKAVRLLAQAREASRGGTTAG